jgi:hypothetical protein
MTDMTLNIQEISFLLLGYKKYLEVRGIELIEQPRGDLGIQLLAKAQDVVKSLDLSLYKYEFRIAKKLEYQLRKNLKYNGLPKDRKKKVILKLKV